MTEFKCFIEYRVHDREWVAFASYRDLSEAEKALKTLRQINLGVEFRIKEPG